ncbi:MAG: DNRLRE domain-containing protein [Actinomycetota bacterium]|nr:DNRLRE domain-containing protein [Actinomycetota bacterium]
MPFGTQTNNEPIHALLRADLSSIPKDAVVTSAKLSAYVEMVGFVDTIKVQALTRSWDTSANWYNPCPATCTNWTTAGGDVSADPDYTAPGYSVANVDSARWVDWYITELAQDWVRPASPGGTGIPNYGVLIRRADETAYGQDSLVSSTSTDTAKRPSFSVTYSRRTGLRPSAKFDTRELSDRHSASVNLANGNLLIRAADVAIKGTGLDLAVERFSNSMGAQSGDAWRFSVGQWVWAETQPDGSVVLREPGGAYVPYVKKTTTPTFTTPPGANADLTKSGSTYTLTRHQSGEVFKFGTVANSIGGSRAYLSSIADRNGNTITFAYDTSNRVTSLTDTQGRSLTFAYTSGLLTSISDWAGRAWSYGYTGTDVSSYTDPAGKVTTYGYDANGRINQITTPSGIAGGTITKVVYNSDGSVQKLSRVKDGSGGTYDWTYAYSSTAQSGGTRCTQYGGSAPAKMLGCITVTDPRGFLTSHGWDESDQVVKAIDAAGNVRNSTYGANENVAEYKNSLSAVSTLTYDTVNRVNLTKVLSPSSNGTNTGATTNFSYNAPNPGNGTSLYKYLPSSRTDPQSSCTAFGYDGYGNAKKVTPGLTPSGTTPQCDTPPSGSAAYTYAYQGDDSGAVTCNAKPRQLCTATDPKGNVTKYGYDGSTKGNLTSVTPPPCTGCPGATTITVDALSRTSTVTDGKGQKTTYTYDKLDRVTRVTFNGDTACASRSTCVDFAYDGNGNLTSRSSSIGTTTFTYDQLNQVIKKVLPGPLVNACSGQTGMTFTYDAVGNLSTLCDAGGTVTYRYNGNNELTSTQEPGGNCAVSPVTGPCTVIGYTDANGVYQDGRRMSVTFPPSTGTVMKMTYDRAGNLGSIIATKGTTTLSSFSYTYAVGTTDTELRRSMTTPSGTTSYGYDALNRLCYEYAGSSTAACGSVPSGASTWAYDTAGNRTTQVAGGVTTSYAYNGANQLCATSTSGTPS